MDLRPTGAEEAVDPVEKAKRAAAEAAASLVSDGMRVGLGTGTTVAYLLPALAGRGLDVVCVATSPATEEQALSLGLDVRPFEELDRLDIAIDGADQVTPEGWLVKGAGGAHTREKVVAAAAECFVVIVSDDKLVSAMEPPIPLELLAYGLAATLRHLGDVRLRGCPLSPDGGVIADWWGEITSPEELAGRFGSQPGVVEHGIFPAEMIDTVIAGGLDGDVRKVFG